MDFETGEGVGVSKLTKFQIKALTIIKNNPGIRARGLSKKLWPDSETHKRNYKSGYGTAIGKGAWLIAGSYVAKLIKKGWVKERAGYQITTEGKRVLLDSEMVDT